MSPSIIAVYCRPPIRSPFPVPSVGGRGRTQKPLPLISGKCAAYLEGLCAENEVVVRRVGGSVHGRRSSERADSNTSEERGCLWQKPLKGVCLCRSPS